AVGVEVDWSLDVTAANPLASRARNLGSIVFDNAGNLYWKGSGNPCFLCSATPTGTLRWISNAVGAPVSLGGDDSTSPVVGDGQRVYVVTDTGVAAFKKTNGDLVWTTVLPNCNYAGTDQRLTPILYNGKLYAVSSGVPGKTIYQVNSLTGAIDWSSTFNVTLNTGWGELKGRMTLVPNAFGAGVHGLYFNADGGGVTGGQGMYAMAVTPATGATLAWSDVGGKVYRSHVIYVPSAGRVCTATWPDYGACVYCWNLDGSKPAATGQQGTGYSDFGALDFDGNDIISAGFDGKILRTMDVATPGDFIPPIQVVYDSGGFESLTVGDLIGQGGWARDNGGTPQPDAQVVSDPTGSGHGKVIAFAPTGTSPDDYTTYMGAVRAAACTAGNAVTIEWDQYLTDTKGFLWLADNAAYDGWWALMDIGSGFLSASGGGGQIAVTPGVWQHVKYSFDPAGGSVTLQIDNQPSASAGTNDIQIAGIDFEFGPGVSGAGPMYVDNVVIKQGPPPTPPAFAGYGWYQTNNLFYEARGTGGLYQDENGKSIYIDGTDPGVMSARIIGFNVTDSVMYPAPATNSLDPGANEPRLFEYDSGSPGWASGGPLLGPAVTGVRQHIYFFPGNSNSLVALTYLRPIPGDFNGDRVVDQADLFIFLGCAPASGPTVPITDPNCVKCDLDGDQDIDLSDFGIFQRCFNPGFPGNPDCAN
ncbi:MAG TPA: PQQ-binding-like beta-propeller repeat protein, partial [Candidatus Edwardsbacteria bacterium]|nr:PQQ-binding-like beta-propeller repeat protein [Candidatus Edwardsbacteria bacterium]